VRRVEVGISRVGKKRAIKMTNASIDSREKGARDDRTHVDS